LTHYLKLVILIPLLAALATGFLGGLLVLVLAAWRGWPWVYGYIAGVGITFISWLGWSKRFAELIEYTLAPDLHQDKISTDQAPQTINLRIHENKGEYQDGTFLDRLPVRDDELASLANHVISGQSLTTSAVTGMGFDRRTWESLRDRFISAGLLSWRGGTRVHGCEVTSKGLAVFRQMVDRP